MISAFGVEHGEELSKRSKDPKRGDKTFGNPYITGAFAGGAAAMMMGRGRANKWGAGVANRTVNHADWSLRRSASMVNPKLKDTRQKYATKLKRAGQEMGRTNDTKEATGRVTTALGVGTAAGGVVAARKRLTPKENK